MLYSFFFYIFLFFIWPLSHALSLWIFFCIEYCTKKFIFFLFKIILIPPLKYILSSCHNWMIIYNIYKFFSISIMKKIINGCCRAYRHIGDTPTWTERTHCVCKQVTCPNYEECWPSPFSLTLSKHNVYQTRFDELCSTVIL